MEPRIFSELEIEDMIIKYKLGLSYIKIAEVYKTDSLRVRNLLIQYGVINPIKVERHTAIRRYKKVKGVTDIVYNGVQMYDWTQAFMNAWENGEELVRRK